MQYRVPGGRQRRVRLRRFAEGVGKKQTEAARTEAVALLAKVRDGADPAQDRRAKIEQAAQARADTVKDIGQKFIAKHAAQRRWGELKRVMERDVIPAWGTRPVSSITRRDVIEFIDAIVDRGSPIQANRVLVVLKIFFGWTVDRDIIGADPTARVRKPTKEEPRERVLTAPEIAAFWHACEEIGEPFGPLFKLLLLTAQRKSEIAHLEWSEIKEGECLIEIAGAKYKTGNPHVIPLADAALDIIAKRSTRGNKSGLVFTTNDETPVSGFSKAKCQLDAAMLAYLRKDAVEPDKVTLPPWRLHDLRRTARTGLSRLKVPSDIGERVLGHVVGGVRGVYDKYEFLDEKRDALDRWAKHVDTIINPPPSNVVTMPTVAA